jgi:hypothetical protein
MIRGNTCGPENRESWRACRKPATIWAQRAGLSLERDQGQREKPGSTSGFFGKMRFGFAGSFTGLKSA